MLGFAVVGLVAFGVSTLTLFSGFGLGTLLLPAFALFFPVPVAVASTAVVHAANNAFKLVLLRRHVRLPVAVRFGVPAVLAAFVGAALLGALSAQPALVRWRLGDHDAVVTPVKAVMGALILGFAAFELVPGLRALRAPPRWLPLGGAMSGFFGGLSGHQGALRAAFLAPLGLAPAEFAATQAALACGVDLARLSIYGVGLLAIAPAAGGLRWSLVAFATLCAFAGALLGRRLLPKVTLDGVRWITGALLVVAGASLAAGVV